MSVPLYLAATPCGTVGETRRDLVNDHKRYHQGRGNTERGLLGTVCLDTGEEVRENFLEERTWKGR